LILKLKIFLSSFIIIVISFIFFGCGNSIKGYTSVKGSTEIESVQKENGDDNGKKFDGQTLVLTGSTTLLEVTNRWTEEFYKEYGGMITVNGGGSGEGIAALINGTTDIANSSRKIKDTEIQSAEANKVKILEVPILYDGIAIIASKNITVKELTIEQLSKIYTGEIINWKELGGSDKEIILFARDTNSGTGEYFLEEIIQLGKTKKENDYTPMAIRLNSNAEIVNNILDTDNCIGYVSLGFIEPSMNIIIIKKTEASNAVAPCVEAIKDGSYPISRELYKYLNENNISEIAGAYIDFVLSEKGQKIGLEAGFVPIN